MFTEEEQEPAILIDTEAISKMSSADIAVLSHQCQVIARRRDEQDRIRIYSVQIALESELDKRVNDLILL